ncbi:MAG TPA: DUF2501 domain-containing protein [Rudaea sp.]|uniref:DUF2501 domain-containing protein n=1 Tax=Rudaea sp. TaxID=2136325 RepID=UPI002F92D847
MKFLKVFSISLTGSIAILGFCTSAQAGGLGDLAGGGGMGSLASGSAGNAAGVIEFCVKNNYLSGGAAGAMKDKLMGKAGGGEDDPGYADGAKGILKSKDGKSTDLNSLGGGMGGMGDMKAKVTKKACGAVLDHAKSLL